MIMNCVGGSPEGHSGTVLREASGVVVHVVDDDPVSLKLVGTVLEKHGYDVRVHSSAEELLDGIGSGCDESLPEPGRSAGGMLVVADWNMPGMSGLQLCDVLRRRMAERGAYVYFVMLTSNIEHESLLQAFESGVDDYLTKPCNPAELIARIRAGTRMLMLHEDLRRKVKELEEALKRIRQLEELIPICSYCGRIRDDKNYWNRVEEYLEQRTGSRFTHGICPDCYEKHIRPQLEGDDEESS